MLGEFLPTLNGSQGPVASSSTAGFPLWNFTRYEKSPAALVVKVLESASPVCAPLGTLTPVCVLSGSPVHVRLLKRRKSTVLPVGIRLNADPESTLAWSCTTVPMLTVLLVMSASVASRTCV